MKRVYIVTDACNALLQILLDLIETDTEHNRFTPARSSWKKQCPAETTVDLSRSLFGIQKLRISVWTLLTKKLLSQAIVSVFPVQVKLRNNEKSEILLLGWCDNRKS